MPLTQRLGFIGESEKLSIRKQCKILNINRSSYYYQAKEESELNLELMRLMDEHYLQHPYKGARRMHTWLTKDMGYKVNLKRIRRLYTQVMNLRSILPAPNTSKAGKGVDHQVFPYLLRDRTIDAPNEVWAMDITYIPLQKGYMYLNAIIDWHSRFILAWSISNTMEARWCVNTVEEAIEHYGAPKIINTDQGAQFTSNLFVEAIARQPDMKLSMDGKGRCIDNVFIERFWWSIKYEHIYIHAYENGHTLRQGVAQYIDYYNYRRRHQAIEDNFPASRYFPSLPSSFSEEESEEKYLFYLKPA